jgi:hypothetical protein
MGARAAKSVWSADEIKVLRYLLDIYGHCELIYTRATRFFENRTASEIKKRCICIRDLDRRKQRRALEAQAPRGGDGPKRLATCAVAGADGDDGDDDDDDDNAAPLLPVEAQLHPDVVWVPATVWDIGHMTL